MMLTFEASTLRLLLEWYLSNDDVIGALNRFARFLKRYLEISLWSSTDDDGNPLDKDYWLDDFSTVAVRRAIADCRRFFATNAEWLTPDWLVEIDEHRDGMTEDEDIPRRVAARDFWLSRNGHGSGFYDGHWKRAAELALLKSAESFGECNIYVGDDGRLYFQ